MSLAQHLTSIAGVERVEPSVDAVPTKSVHRVLSYDAFPPTQVEDQADHLAAYKVSTVRRAIQVVITVLACWLASGIVFGFAAIKPVLISENVYQELCTDDELQQDVEVCLEQDIRLNFFFTLASITTNVSALPVGAILDRYGPRVCGIFGSIFLATGSIIMSYAFAIPEFDGYLIGNFFLALGGTFIFVPSFHMANAFPKYAGTIVALITGSFDASAAVFLFYRMTYEATEHAFTPDKFFFSYTIIPILILLSQITVLPSNIYDTVPQLEKKIERAHDASRDVHSSDDEITSEDEVDRVRIQRSIRRKNKIRKLDNLLGDQEVRQERADREEERLTKSAVWGILHGLPAHEQMVTPWFILMTLLTVLQMLRMNYFIATIRSQYEFMLDSESLAASINRFFDVALPVGGVVCTPFIGFFLDNLSVPMTLAVIVSLTTAIGVLNSLPILWAAYMTVCLFVVLRPLYYSAMSDYAVKVFGLRTFGRVYGAIICLSGLVNFSQYGIDALTLEVFQGDPTPVNVVLAGAGFAVGTVLVVFVWQKGKQVGDKHGGFGDPERQPLIPEEEDEM
ncbi:MFS transporter [Mollisia scopiformis]|uniref:MFS transporter n=1 Tax=Mollisia scopiformis TaxID=149040 RepID=A0A194XHX0_MOLSC|nr:MFS transporter [Mollisia scopiformis]KUJ19731.1 MFS transporter [Mollisia scopiformis]